MEHLQLLVACSKYWLIFGVCVVTAEWGGGGEWYQTTEKYIKKEGRHLMLRRLFKSTSILVCIWELNVLYYGYIEYFLKLTCKENHPCSTCQRAARKDSWLYSAPSNEDAWNRRGEGEPRSADTGRRNTFHQTEHFGSGNAPLHLIFGTKPENALIHVFSDNPKLERWIFSASSLKFR